jgi:hypothetical protein
MTFTWSVPREVDGYTEALASRRAVMLAGRCAFSVGFDFSKPVLAVVKTGRRSRGTQPVWGQLWIQEDRCVSATNGIPPDTDQSREAIPQKL